MTNRPMDPCPSHDPRLALVEKEFLGEAFLILREDPQVTAEELRERARLRSQRAERSPRRAVGGNALEAVISSGDGPASLSARGALAGLVASENGGTAGRPDELDLAARILQGAEEHARLSSLSLWILSRLKADVPPTIQRGLEWLIATSFGTATYDQISKSSGVSRGTVSSAINRARPYFQELVLRAQASHVSLAASDEQPPELLEVRAAMSASDPAAWVGERAPDLAERHAGEPERMRLEYVARLLDALPEPRKKSQLALQVGAMVLSRKDGKHDEALELLGRAFLCSRNKEEVAKTYNEMGQVEDARGNAALHLKWSMMALDIVPNDAVYLRNVLVAAADMGNEHGVAGALGRIVRFFKGETLRSVHPNYEADRAYLKRRLLEDPRIESVRRREDWSKIERVLGATAESHTQPEGVQ